MVIRRDFAVSALLDTHIFVWWLTEPGKLTPSQFQAIENRVEPVYVSAIVGWEIAITVNLGKWLAAAGLLPDLTGIVLKSGLQPLDVSIAHAERAGLLPLTHRDPFDRLLAAQALELDLTVLTVDQAFTALGCRIG